VRIFLGLFSNSQIVSVSEIEEAGFFSWWPTPNENPGYFVLLEEEKVA